MNEENQENIKRWKEDVQNMKEFEIFLSIDTLGGMKWRELHDYSDGRMDITQEEFDENQEHYQNMINECLPMLPKFQVDPESAKNRENGDYWKWYNFWKNWMNAFTNDAWRQFNKNLSNKEPVDEFLPKTKWNE